MPHSDRFGYRSGFMPDQSIGGISTEEEKNHVIRVLEHESKVYRFEKNLVNSMHMDDYDSYSEQGNMRRHRTRDF